MVCFDPFGLLGGIGGLLQNLRVVLSIYFDPNGTNYYYDILIRFVFLRSFGICVCITKGLVEKSIPMVRKGVLFGIMGGIISVLMGSTFDFPWMDQSLTSMMLLGLFAGLVEGMEFSSRFWKSCASLSGMIGGAIGTLMIHVAKGMALAVAAILTMLSLDKPAIVFYNYLIPVFYGAGQSVSIWFFIAIADRFYVRLKEPR